MRSLDATHSTPLGLFDDLLAGLAAEGQVLVDHGDDAIDDRYGKVIPGREGEAWFLDEFGGFGKVALFAAPTAALAARFDTNPHRARQRSQATQRS